MSIAEKIQAVVNDVLPEWTFVLDDWRGVDKLLTRKTLPAVFCIMPNAGRIEYRNDKLRHTQDVALAIAWKVVKDADGDDNDSAIEESVHVAGRLLQGFARSGYFAPFGVVNYTTFYEQLSSVVTGIVLQLTFEEESKCVY